MIFLCHFRRKMVFSKKQAEAAVLKSPGIQRSSCVFGLIFIRRPGKIRKTLYFQTGPNVHTALVIFNSTGHIAVKENPKENRPFHPFTAFRAWLATRFERIPPPAVLPPASVIPRLPPECPSFPPLKLETPGSTAWFHTSPTHIGFPGHIFQSRLPQW